MFLGIFWCYVKGFYVYLIKGRSLKKIFLVVKVVVKFRSVWNEINIVWIGCY